MPLEDTILASCLAIIILAVVWVCYEAWRAEDDERRNGPRSQDPWQGPPGDKL